MRTFLKRAIKDVMKPDTFFSRFNFLSKSGIGEYHKFLSLLAIKTGTLNFIMRKLSKSIAEGFRIPVTWYERKCF